MILAGHQPEYLPYIGFFNKMMLCDIFVIVDHVQYQKKSWQNRNRIRTKDGELLLTVPVLTKGKFDQAIEEVEINNNENWGVKHLRSLKINYSKAPYFKDYEGFFEEIYSQTWSKLVDLSETIIKYIAGQLGISKKIMKSSQIKPNGRKTDMLIDMCKKLGCDTYLSGVGGRLYVDDYRFKVENLNHIYTDFKHPTYKQLYEPFILNLSVIDLIFNYGNEKSREIILNSGAVSCL